MSGGGETEGIARRLTLTALPPHALVIYRSLDPLHSSPRSQFALGDDMSSSKPERAYFLGCWDGRRSGEGLNLRADVDGWSESDRGEKQSLVRVTGSRRVKRSSRLLTLHGLVKEKGGREELVGGAEVDSTISRGAAVVSASSFRHKQ